MRLKLSLTSAGSGLSGHFVVGTRVSSAQTGSRVDLLEVAGQDIKASL